MASLTKSTTVQQTDSHTYTIDFDPAWTIGAGKSTIPPKKRNATVVSIFSSTLTTPSPPWRLRNSRLHASRQLTLRHDSRQTKPTTHRDSTLRLPAPHTSRPGNFHRQRRQTRPPDVRRARYAPARRPRRSRGLYHELQLRHRIRRVLLNGVETSTCSCNCRFEQVRQR
jgi:hypothetical protein